MPKTVAYVRVSTKEQCLERQLAVLKELGIEEKYIYQDKQSGKDLDRIGYQYMKKCLESGDTLVIKELDRIAKEIWVDTFSISTFNSHIKKIRELDINPVTFDNVLNGKKVPYETIPNFSLLDNREIEFIKRNIIQF